MEPSKQDESWIWKIKIINFYTAKFLYSLEEKKDEFLYSWLSEKNNTRFLEGANLKIQHHMISSASIDIFIHHTGALEVQDAAYFIERGCFDEYNYSTWW